MAFVRHDGLTLSAALAFYVALSFAPTIVLSIWAAASVSDATKVQLLKEFAVLGGRDVRAAAQLIIDNAQKQPTFGSIAGVIGIVTMVVGASAVFAQLQSSLNAIWHIEAKPIHAVWHWVRDRLLSLGTLAAVAFVLIVSLVVSAILTVVFGKTGMLWELLNQGVSLAVFTAMFAALFRYLPNARMPWRDTLRGALLTAVLFTLGKFVIGQYLAHSNVGGSYGPAGSLIVLLVWVYYSSAVFFFGAELVGRLAQAPARGPKASTG